MSLAERVSDENQLDEGPADFSSESVLGADINKDWQVLAASMTPADYVFESLLSIYAQRSEARGDNRRFSNKGTLKYIETEKKWVIE